MEDRIHTRVLGIRKATTKLREHMENTQQEKTGPIDERPQSVYEIVTRRMLEELRDDVNEIKGRVNALLWLMLGALAMEFVMRLVR